MESRLFYAAALAIAFAGCSDDDGGVLEQPDRMTDTPITVTANVTDLGSRAGYDNDNLPDRFIMYVVQDKSGTSKYNYGKADMSFNSETGKWEAKNLPEGTLLLWKNSAPSATVSAYTPQANSNMYYWKGGLATFKENFSGTSTGVLENMLVLEDQSTEEKLKQSDFLHYRGTNVNPNADGSISIPFSHVLCKLRVAYSYGTEIGSSALSITKCEISNVRTKFVMDFLRGEESGTTAADGGYDKTVSGYVDEAAKTVEFILPSQDFSAAKARLSFYVNVDGVDKIFSCEVDAASFEYRTLYDMAVTIGRDKVDMGEVAVDPWNTDTDGGALETE